MTVAELKEKLQALNPDAEVDVRDLTGTSDHFEAHVVSSAFEGKARLERQRMVMGLLQKEMDSGEVHALTFRTFTPEEFKSKETKSYE